MSLVDDARAIEVAAQTTRTWCQSYYNAFVHANAELTRLSREPRYQAAQLTFAVIPMPAPVTLLRLTGTIDPVFAALASQIAGPVGVTARRLAQEAGVLKARLDEMRGIVSRITTGLSDQKTAEYVAQALHVGVAAHDLAGRFIAIHRQSLWSRFDPRDTPLVFMAFQSPTGASAVDWVDQVYRALAGSAYATAHPLRDLPGVDPGGGGGGGGGRQGWGVGTYVSIGLGVIGGVLIIKALGRRT